VVGRVLPDNAVCALSQLLGHIVALVNDEFLVEDLPMSSVHQTVAELDAALTLKTFLPARSDIVADVER
jgi:hypothetical protein